ncbi:MAG: hypothetical protein GXP53_13620 [Deltaproteobacteria bacterium]|nr:hypothetical protein [Deltaproteobacteria bacterium]
MRFFFFIIGSIVILAAIAVSHFPERMLFMATGASLIFILVLIKTEVGLYLLIFSMLLSPEFMFGGGAAGTVHRGVTLRIDDLLLLVIALSWFARNAIFKDIGLFFKTPINRPIFFYIIANIVATGLGAMAGRVDLEVGFFYVLKYIEYFIVFFMVANHMKDTDQAKRFVFFLFLTCFIVSIMGMLQIPSGQRVSAPFEGKVGEPNTFGGYLVFMLAIAAGLFYHIRDTKTRNLLLLLMAAIIPPFLFTGSRSSFLAFIPMAVALGVMMKNRVIIFGLMAAILIISPLILPQAVKERILYTVAQPEESGQIEVGGLRLDTSTSARLKSWEDALTRFPEHPVFGFGVTGFHFIDAQFPRVLVETGLIGFASFLILLFSIFAMAVENYRRAISPFARGLTMGYIAGFIALVVHCIGANTFIIVRIMEPFWFFTGIVCMLPVLEERDAAVKSENGDAKPIRRFGRHFSPGPMPGR